MWFGSAAKPSQAHPMGNFSINHYARFEAKAGGLALRTILDFAEIPTSERMDKLDANGDEKISETEKSAFLKAEVAASLPGFSVKVDGTKALLKPRPSQLDIRPGAAGLQTLRVVMNWDIAFNFASSGAPVHRIEYVDSNFPDRNGWMEVIAVSAPPQKIRDSDAATQDRSRELTVFPVSGDTAPPRQREATFSVVNNSVVNSSGVNNSVVSKNAAPENTAPGGSDAPSTTLERVAPATNSQTPQNRFTQSIAERELTPGLVLGGLFAALAFGAVHALSPGHGKTMVAAYLVGSRGTPRHAILLGLVVTITHTLGVFALGLALLFASRYILPERLFPALSALSGLLIFGVGLWLFMSRWQLLSSENQGHHHVHDSHSHDHGDYSHDSHSHDHSHSHESGVHSHGGKAHSHAVPEGPITLRTLVALGISGGIVPCPEALVVLLAAVKLHRIGYGMLLITAFSIGLAAALIAIGLFVVAARERFGASARFGSGGGFARYLPIGSAAAITVIGIVLTLRAVVTGGV